MNTHCPARPLNLLLAQSIARYAIRFHLTAALCLLPSLVTTAATFIVSTNSDSGPGSFRQAILDANLTTASDTIHFAIGSGGQTIRPISPLPDITRPVMIDGYTQPGYTDSPLIELDGSQTAREGEIHGLRLRTSGCTIRGLVINRFLNSAIRLQGGGNHLIEGNFLGTDRTGMIALGNGGHGINVYGAVGNRIGGAKRNLISGNIDNGIILSTGAADNSVEGNWIGVNADGTGFLGNGGRGVWVQDAATVRNRIGGVEPGAGNVIAGNQFAGVLVNDGATQTAILGNSIFANAQLGINLADDDVSDNDPLDTDTGGNFKQNFPVLGEVTAQGSSLAVRGVLHSAANAVFRLELFASETNDATGYGEGQWFLGATNATSDAQGRAEFFATLPAPADAFSFICATATDASGNTSEFSRSVRPSVDLCDGLVEQFSPFDTDAEGWKTWTNDGIGHGDATSRASGGRPGGYISRSDGGGDSHTTWFDAPTRFTGDKSAFYRGSLSFDQTWDHTTADAGIRDHVQLQGAGMLLLAPLTNTPGHGVWTAYRLALDESAGWRLGSNDGPVATEAQFPQVLGALEFLRIRAEFRSGGEVISLDNVRLTAPPRLHIRPLGAATWAIEWPAQADRFQLESTASLSASPWEPVTAPRERMGSWLRVRVGTGLGHQFFRLRRAE